MDFYRQRAASHELQQGWIFAWTGDVRWMAEADNTSADARSLSPRELLARPVYVAGNERAKRRHRNHVYDKHDQHQCNHCSNSRKVVRVRPNRGGTSDNSDKICSAAQSSIKCLYALLGKYAGQELSFCSGSNGHRIEAGGRECL
jgi:hypothetical protein